MLALYTPVSQRRWDSFKIIRYFCIYCNEMKVDAAQSGCIFVTYNESSAHSTHAWIQLNGGVLQTKQVVVFLIAS